MLTYSVADTFLLFAVLNGGLFVSAYVLLANDFKYFFKSHSEPSFVAIFDIDESDIIVSH